MHGAQHFLAAYRVWKAEGESLDAYLEKKVFGGQHGTVMEPDAEDVKGFDEFMVRYHAGLPIERSAVETMPGKIKSDQGGNSYAGSIKTAGI